jgi:peptidoglycan/LPS O-acetylase OafA/YrhL
MTARPSERLRALDGLRGWAALSVIVFHLTWETFGALYPVLRSFPVALVGNGNFAVALFLKVSGYVLTWRGWHSDDKAPIVHAILKRYFRLTFPIAVSVLLFWAVLALGWTSNETAGAIVHRPGWLQRFGHVEPDFVDALSFGLAGVYLHISPSGYGPFLWTMVAELWGSYVVLGLCLVELPGRLTYLPLAGLTVAGLFSPALHPLFPIAACYPAGALMALLTRDGLIGSGEPSARESRLAGGVLVVTLSAAAVGEMAKIDPAFTTVLAMATFVAALRCRTSAALLALPVSQWLGRISFPLYLLQIVVITVFTSGLIVLFDAVHILTLWTALGIAVASLVACLVAAHLFLPVERFAIALSAQIGGRAPVVARVPDERTLRSGKLALTK